MTKEQLVEAVAKEIKSSKAMAALAVKAVLANITMTLKKGQSITLTGFGTFLVGKRKARMGVNPRTGAKIKIAATKVPRFKAGKALKMAVKK
jgi:DNA-binding protein HU-beta